MQEVKSDLAYYNVTFFDGVRRRKDHRIWLPGKYMEAACNPNLSDFGRTARDLVMLVAIAPLRLTPKDMNWSWFVFVNLEVPPFVNIP